MILTFCRCCLIIFICCSLLMRRLSSKFKLIMNLTLFSVLICFILLAHNVILVNEESLILICFIITINILIKQFNHLLDSPFQSSKISNRENLNSVLSKIEKSLENLISYLTKNSFLIDVKKFNKYLLNLVNNFTY